MAGERENARRLLLERVVAEMRETGDLTGCYRLSDRVLQAMATVPRHRFVPVEERELAYADIPLPIGRGQTISQPFIVALMTELLRPDPQAVVLEIGTGSGYQAAVLASLVRQVYSVERIPELAEDASRRLRELGYANVEVRVADGGCGWEERAPFDGIVVTAAAADVPLALVQQLKPGGRLVVPVGERHRSQDLRVIGKDEQGSVETRSVLPVVFVPLVRDGG
ncbi:MAG TPA: protein-L-isoaspartate(D-aspartate) O-methyltransferase [Candidatus Competibacter sp.]|nr:protein-L-isoaspartate(D-aspartate) O-methyltransferase [Candidatus Competibacter sp.]